MFSAGRKYTRRKLHVTYGGQRQSGISTPKEHNFIMLFTGSTGEQYGYADQWDDDGLYSYTGEGQEGDMVFERGNKAVRDHAENGKDLYLFQAAGNGYVRYIDQMVYTGHQIKTRPDLQGESREAIIFELSSMSSLVDDESELSYDDRQETLDALRKKAKEAASTGNSPVERRANVYQRSKDVRDYVLMRANGQCEGCSESAPFVTKKDRPYLETHHIRRVSDGGPDDLAWVAGVCPNCHRRAHYSADRMTFNADLRSSVLRKESDL